MKRLVFLTAAALGALVSVSTTAKAEPLLDPNLPYCLSAGGGGTPWCGYRSLSQCQESASGTGRDCQVNVWINATVSGDAPMQNAMAQVRRVKHHP